MRISRYDKIGAFLSEDCTPNTSPASIYNGMSTTSSSAYGTLFDFDGTNSIQTPTFQHFIQRTGVFTIAFRAKLIGVTGTKIPMYSLDGDNGWTLYFLNADRLYMSAKNNAQGVIGVDYFNLSLGGGVTTTDWNDYVIIGDGTTVTLYVNGNEIDTMAVATGNLTPDTGDQVQPTIIGAATNGVIGSLTSIVITPYMWSARDIENYTNLDEFDCEKDIYSKWELSSTTDTNDSSFKASNGDSSYGFDGAKVGTFSDTEFNDRLGQNALVFPGTAYLTFDSDIAQQLSGKSEISLSCWVKNTSGGTIIAIMADSDDPLFEVTINSNGTISVTVTTDIFAPDGVTVTSNIKIPDTEWHHILATVDLSSDAICIFIDGTADDSVHTGTGGSEFPPDFHTTSYLGTNADQSKTFTGTLSNIKLFEKTLSMQEGREHAQKVIYNVPQYDIIYWSCSNLNLWADTGLSYEMGDDGITSAGGLSIFGDYMFVGEGGGNDLYKFNMPDTNIENISLAQTKTLTECTNLEQVIVSGDGTKLIACDRTGYSIANHIRGYDFGTPWDISTLTADGNTITLNGFQETPHGIWVSPDGLNLLVAVADGVSGEDILEWDLGTAWDLSTATNLVETNFEQRATTIAMNPSGTQIFSMSQSGSRYVVGNSLNTPWKVSAGVTTLTGSAGPDSGSSIAMSKDGKIAYITDLFAGTTCHQWNTDASV